MSTTTLSSKFHITVPAQARPAPSLEAGRRPEVTVRSDRLEMVRVVPMSAYRGFLRGKLPDSAVERDSDRDSDGPL